MMQFWLLLAQATTQPAGGQPPPQPADAFWRFMMPLLLALAVFYFILFRGQRKERHRTRQMLEALKRNDRVQTIGGMYGTVVDVRGNEVLLKVDEASNVKVRFHRSAIKEVLSEAPAAEEKK